MTEHPPGTPADGGSTAGQLNPQEEQALRDQVGDELREGFAALASPALPEDARPRWHQRLIAITNSAKHDLPTAARRLDRFWGDWEDEVGPRPT